MGYAGGIRVLVCSDAFYPPKGGGVISLRAICAGLAKKGYDISSYYLGSERDPAWSSHPQGFSLFLKGMWPRNWELKNRWRNAVGNFIESEGVDLVITQQSVAVPTIEACYTLGIPVMLLVQSMDHFCLGSFWSGTPWKCEYKCVGCKDSGERLWQFPFFRAEISETRDSFGKADAVISNSEFTRRTLEMIWGVKSQVVPPISKDPAAVRKAANRNKILFFSPLAHKGVDVALQIAKTMPSEEFMFVGEARRRTKEKMRSIGNIEYIPWTFETRPLYEQAKLLIMPSLIPEGYGMACVEAMRRGIPCIVSDAGALPETLGGGGEVVGKYRDSNEWVKILKKYQDPHYLANKSEDALKESTRFTGLRSVNRINEILESMLAE